MVIPMFNFLRNCQTFATVAEPFYIPTNNVWKSLPTLVIFPFFIIALLVGMKWYLIVMCISLMTYDIEHLFIMLIGQWSIFFGEKSTQILCPFFVFLCVFLNWSTVDLHCCAHLCHTAKWLSFTHIYILFKYSFPLWLIPGDWIQFPVLHSRTLPFIHSKCNSLHLPTPNSHSITLPPCLPLGNHKSDLYVCESVSV